MERVTVAATKRSSFGASRKRVVACSGRNEPLWAASSLAAAGRLHGVGVDDERRGRVVEGPPLQFLARDGDIGRAQVDVMARTDRGVPLVPARPVGEEDAPQRQPDGVGMAAGGRRASGWRWRR